MSVPHYDCSPHSAFDLGTRRDLQLREYESVLPTFIRRVRGAQAEGVDRVRLQTPGSPAASRYRGYEPDSAAASASRLRPVGVRAHARAGRRSRGPRPGLAKPEVS